MSIKIVKRIPFGFVGDWGKVYKRYIPKPQEMLAVDDETTMLVQNNYYVCTGELVQFREASDEQSMTETPHKGMLANAEAISVSTTDAYYDITQKQHKCIVQSGDIVLVFGRKWMVGRVTSTVMRRVPNPLKLYIIDLSAIL